MGKTTSVNSLCLFCLFPLSAWKRKKCLVGFLLDSSLAFYGYLHEVLLETLRVWILSGQNNKKER